LPPEAIPGAVFFGDRPARARFLQPAMHPPDPTMKPPESVSPVLEEPKGDTMKGVRNASLIARWPSNAPQQFVVVVERVEPASDQEGDR